MKITHVLAFSLVLTACGEKASDTGSNDTGTAPATTTARFAGEAPVLEAERAAPAAAQIAKARGTSKLAPTGNSSARIGTAPSTRTAEAAEISVAPRLAPLPSEPTDDDLSVLTISTDSGGDGTIDRVQRSYFDARSNRVMLEEDRDGDGVFEKVEAFFHLYNDDGRLYRIETDEGADGSIDGVEVRTFNDMGRALMIERDEDGDGAWDKIERNTWDAEGRRTEWVVDSPVDGQPDMVQTWAFGPDGRSHARTLERYSAGKLLNTTEYAHAFGEDGKVVSMQVDGPTARNEIHREYDAQGRLVAALTDTGRDGSIDSRTTYTYDDAGRLVKLEINAGADGKPTTIIHRSYDNFSKPNIGGCP